MNSFIIHDWMVKELGLSGNELLIYAIIYNVSQDGASKFAASQKYLAEMIGITDRTVRNTLASMVEKGLLHKFSSSCGGSDEYRAEKFSEGVGKNFLGGRKNFPMGAEKISSEPRAYRNNINNNLDRVYNNLLDCTIREDKNTTTVETIDNTSIAVIEEKKELDKEKIDREKEIKNKEKEIEQKENEQENKERIHPNQKLEYSKGIRLTVNEFNKMVELYGERDAWGIIEWFSLYKADKGYKNKSDYMAVRRWVADAYKKDKGRQSSGLFDEYRKAFETLREKYG